MDSMKKLDKNFIEEFFLDENRVLFMDCYTTDLRIPDSRIPEGWYKYEVRETDDGEPWGTLERRVIVNHSFTVLFPHEIEIPECGYIEFGDD